MRGKSDCVGAVDFGSREVRVIIARKELGGGLQIIGHGTAPGHGCVSQGVVQDLNAAQLALKSALGEAEKEARVKIRSLFCGINGRNVETFVREGQVRLESESVERAHMDEALDIASRDVLEAGKRVLSSISAQEWYVDGLRVIDPNGIRGHVLKTRVHFARIPAVIEDNIAQCIEAQRCELEDVIFLPLAASLGCLTPEDTELGVALLDLGRTTTGLAVYRDRSIIGTHCFEWGGYHLTRDVSAGLHVSFEEADELIMEYGVSDEFINEEEEDAAIAVPFTRRRSVNAANIKLKTTVHGAAPIVPREQLDMVIYERAKELLTKVRQNLHSRGHMKHLIRGLVLTGGSANIKNYVKLAEAVFQVPCRVGIPGSVESIPHALKAPEFSAAIGIARHGFDFRGAQGKGHLSASGPVASGARRLSKAFRKYFF